MVKTISNRNNIQNVRYQLVPPDGGWGYVVASSVTLVLIIYNIPSMTFGLLFGEFLESIGDETTGTAMANGLFNTISNFMGLIAGALLNMYSPRQVAIMGGATMTIGFAGLIFTYNLPLFLSFYSVQGIGFGMITPALLSSFDSYFDKRLPLIMSISQAVLIAAYMLLPLFASFLMNNFGYRGSLIVVAGLSVFNLPMLYLLHPVKRHMKKVAIDTEINSTAFSLNNYHEKTKSLGDDVLRSQIEPLVNQITKDNNNPDQQSLKPHFNKNITETKYFSNKSLNKYANARKSIISLGDRIASVSKLYGIQENDEDVEQSFWKTLMDAFDFSLLKSIRFNNFVIGLAFIFAADMTFIAVIPMILKNIGFDFHVQTFMMSVFYGSDLVARILLSIVSYKFTFKSRYIVFGGATLSAIFRIVWGSNDTYYWRLSFLAVLGFLRCFVNTTVPLAITEEYPGQFSNAFSLNMAFCGVVCLGLGPLMSIVKDITQSDVMVCHILTVMFLICTVTWTIEFVFFRKKKLKLNDSSA